MKIERVQYDGEGQWLDVTFDDGKRARLPVALVREVARAYTEHLERFPDAEDFLKEMNS